MTNENPVIFDLSVTVPTTRNKTDYESDVGQRGVDQLQMPETAPATKDAGSGGTGSGTTLPTGAAGDMLYHDGSDWVLIAAPTVSVADPVLRHNGTAPYWEEPEGCV